MGQKRGGGLQQQADCLAMYFAKITSWSAKAEKIAEQQAACFDIVGVVEHHHRGEKLIKTRRRLQQLGWHTSAAPAELTAANGTSGDALLMAQKGLSSRAARRPAGKATVGSWTCRLVSVAGFELGIAVLYFRPVDLEGSLSLLEEVSTWLRMLKAPFVVFADWNQEPTSAEALAWAAVLRGQYKVPGNTSWTCSSGQQRMLDYLLVSPDL